MQTQEGRLQVIQKADTSPSCNIIWLAAREPNERETEGMGDLKDVQVQTKDKQI